MVKEKQLKQTKTPQIIIDYEEFGVMKNMSFPYYKERGEQALKNTLEYFKKERSNKDIQDNGAYLMTLLKADAGQNNKPKMLVVPNIHDGTKLQAWAIANGLPTAPVGYNTYQYRQMLYEKIKKNNTPQGSY